MDSDLKSLDRLLKALADPTRLRIVGVLAGAGAVCVCHIHDSLRIPQPKASRHLAYLRRAGVVAAEKRGLWVYYTLAAQPPVAQTLLDAARHCVAHLSTAKRDAKRLERETGCCVAPSDAPRLACCASVSDAAPAAAVSS
jgi:ArsR family transcriptional regulator